MLTVCFTVDYEPDCPPYMRDTFRGVEEGTAPLLAMLREEGVPATVFSTGEVAERYPDAIRAIVAAGHELGSHGHTHRKFTELAPDDARAEIDTSAAVLRAFAPVTSFRAPNLLFPPAYLALLERAAFTLDSSAARYKRAPRDAAAPPTRLTRVPASVTSSVLRLPRLLRDAYLSALAPPVVLFVHPWEFVDLRHTRLRLDCRFNTGEIARRRVREVLQSFAARGARFARMGELAAP
jgi:peptidoglycan/xylan/chitin deacetylase (PgdA/CDA1 family)